MMPSSEDLAVAQIAEMELCFFNKTAAQHLLRRVYHHQEKALRSLRCFPRWAHDRGGKLKLDAFLSNKGLLHTLSHRLRDGSFAFRAQGRNEKILLRPFAGRSGFSKLCHRKACATSRLSDVFFIVFSQSFRNYSHSSRSCSFAFHSPNPFSLGSIQSIRTWKRRRNEGQTCFFQPSPKQNVILGVW